MVFVWDSSKNTWGYSYSVTDHKITTLFDGPRTQSATALPSSAKSYVEVSFDTVVGSDIRVGLSSSGWSDYTGLTDITSAGSIGMIWGNTGYDFIYLQGNGGSATNVKTGPWVGADVARIAIDRTVSPPLAWLTVNGGDWNGDPTANPATGIGGIDVSFISGNPYVAISHLTGAAGGINTVNGGESAFTYTKPSGFVGPAEPAGVTLTGQAVAIPTGSVKPSLAKAPTGQSVTTSAGTLAPARTVALTGLSLSSASGTLASARAKAITGQTLTASAGTLAPATSKSLSGQAATPSVGSLAPALPITLVGQSVTASRGALSPASTKALTGSSTTIGQGNASAGNDVTAALTGQAMTAPPGLLATFSSIALAGQSATGSTGVLVTATSRSISGQSAAVSLGAITAFSSFALTGEAASIAMLGYGSTFEVEDEAGSGSFVELAEAGQITPPNLQLDQVEVTHMQSPDRVKEFIQGLTDLGEVQVEFNYVPSSATDDFILAWRLSGDRRACRITYPAVADADPVTDTFPAFVLGYAPTLPTQDKAAVVLSLKVAGAVTRAAGWPD